MRALFTFSYIVRIVVIHFILIESSIVYAKKYQIDRTESNFESLEEQRNGTSPTYEKEISRSNISKENPSDITLERNNLTEPGRKNELFFNESVQTPIEDGGKVGPSESSLPRSGRRCFLAGMMHKKLQFGKNLWFGMPRWSPPKIIRRPARVIIRPRVPLIIRPPSPVIFHVPKRPCKRKTRRPPVTTPRVVVFVTFKPPTIKKWIAIRTTEQTTTPIPVEATEQTTQQTVTIEQTTQQTVTTTPRPVTKRKRPPPRKTTPRRKLTTYRWSLARPTSTPSVALETEIPNKIEERPKQKLTTYRWSLARPTSTPSVALETEIPNKIEERPKQKLTTYRWGFARPTSTPSSALQTTISNEIEEGPTEPQGYVLPKPTPAAPWQELQPNRSPLETNNSLVMKFKPDRTGTVVAGCRFLANPGVVVMNGMPKYDIELATVVEKIMLIQRVPGYFAWEFVHPITHVCIELPASVESDTYVNPVTKKIFIIFVDNTNTTLLVPKLKPIGRVSEICIFNYSKEVILEKYWKGWRLGSIVLNGLPVHNIRNAIWVWHTMKMIDSNGILIYEFTHPINKHAVRIPVFGSDEYFIRETSQVFLLFVDRRNRTLAIYKGVMEQHKSVREDQKFGHLKKEDEVRLIEKYRQFGYKYGWGSIVIGGVPKYDLTAAKLVNKTEKIIDNDGFLVTQFEHPITEQRIQIPTNSGDEYVLPSLSKKFDIFVDSAKRTLLIAKEEFESNSIITKDCVDKLNINVTLAILKYQQLTYKVHLGTMVINGVPTYDISTAIFVNETYNVIDTDGFLMTYFIHPMTGKSIQIPFDGSDEYVLANESKVYVIFVDNVGQTLLIFKDNNLKKRGTPPRDKTKGSIVVNGVPRYNASCVIFVNKTDKLLHSQKNPVIQFVHPTTGEKIQIPADGGDEFLVPSTSEIFLIFVDSQDRTLLIFKDKYVPKQPINGNDRCPNILSTVIKYREMAREREWGSMVVHGVPKYNKSCGIVVNKTENFIDSDGCMGIQFVHPITEQRIKIPANGGDEYVMPLSSKIFVIFVDTKGRTLLIPKTDDPPNKANPAHNPGGNCKNVLYAINKYRQLSREKGWGSMVIHGVPKYDTSFGIFVDKTHKILDSEGCVVIEFVDPSTGQKIQIPYHGGDEFVVPSSSKIFVIFVDKKGRTLLVFKEKLSSESKPANGSVAKCKSVIDSIKKYQQMAREKEWGSVVIRGVPKYDTSPVIFVYKTNKTLDSDGCLRIEFVHPVTKQDIQIPYNGGDEFMMPLASMVFVIFVDAKDRTLFIFKDSYPSKEAKGTDEPDDKNQNTSNAINKYQEMAKEKESGSMVIDGVPTYNISGAIFVDETDRIKDPDGFLLIHFVHPITGQNIKIPYYGGDTYALPYTPKVYVIFVDTRGRTLLILKPQRPSKTNIQENNKNVSFVIEKYGEMAKKNEWGSLVIGGVPKHDISSGIFVNNTENKIDSDGCLVIKFTHPITGQKILIPYHGGDEYVLPKTSKIYIIFVDNRDRTLLILKNEYSSSETKPEKGLDDTSKNQSNFAIKKYQEIANKNEWGSIVIRGVPKYDTSSAIFVNETEKIVDPDGCLIIQFVHPITGQKIQIPYHGGDEYVMPITPKIYIIFVDIKDRTLLILKKDYPSNEAKPEKEFDNMSGNVNFAIKKYQEIANKNKWGSIVIRGVPKYDTTRAIFVNNTENKIDSDGFLVIQFTHPITEQKMVIPYHGGDEFAPPRTSKIYIIFVDIKNRTLLILKKDYPSNEAQPEKEFDNMSGNVNFAIKKYQKIANKNKWGLIVIRGVPKYDTTRAIFVNNTENKIDSDGFLVIQFTHPITEQKMVIPYHGGDEFAPPRTSKIYIIFVDIKNRTLLILKKDYPSNGAKPEKEFDNMSGNVNFAIKKYQEIADKNEWGSIVIRGVPKYDTSSAIFVNETEKIVDPDGCLIIQFVHPMTGQKIQIPYHGGDEYVMPLTSKIYIIFVDIKNRTLLILKKDYPSNGAKPEKDFDTMSGNVNFAIKKYQEIADKNEWGSIVIRGLPKYDTSSAIFVNETEKIVDPDACLIIQFVHPMTGQKIQIPYHGGDEYVMPLTSKIYIIFVDIKNRTLLILKKDYPSNGAKPEKEFDNTSGNVNFAIKKYQEIANKNKWGSIVIRGVPKYDTTRAIFVNNTENKIDSDGFLVIQFTHPITDQKMVIPYHGGDEFVTPKTLKIYIIFVDIKDRTLLILKNEYPSNEMKPEKAPDDVWLGKQSITDNVNSIMFTPNNKKATVLKKWSKLSMDKGWGWLVVKGFPKYDISQAVFVMKSERKIIDKYDVEFIRFLHPVTGQMILVPLVGSDEIVMPRTSQVFLIFVDLEGRTLLILKEKGKKHQNIGWGSVVIDGYPKYDLSQAIYVIERETTIVRNGTVMMQFVHPKTREKVRMPFSGGDEYTGPLTLKIFVIVVDSRGRTLLIFKGMNEAKLNDRRKEKIDMMIKQYNTKARMNGWGTLVIRGMPKYDLSSGIIVIETKTKVHDKGMVMIQFDHPKNKRKIMIPFIGGDEYVDSLTSNVYIIFVDLQGQLLLVFKGIQNSEAFEPMESLEIGSDRDKKELDRFIKEYKAVANRNKWGTLVTNRVPNYNLKKAIIVEITNKTWTNSGFPIIRFVHPINGVDMYIPTYGSDEYVDPKTFRKFIIFVDTEDRTCLIPRDDYKNNKLNYGSNDQEIMENMENGTGSPASRQNISGPVEEYLNININKNINNNVFLAR